MGAAPKANIVMFRLFKEGIPCVSAMISTFENIAATEKHPHLSVINCSCGFEPSDVSKLTNLLFSHCVTGMVTRGYTIVAAAGNEGKQLVTAATKPVVRARPVLGFILRIWLTLLL